MKPELKLNGDYQRLEFIGDKILGQVISDILFDHYPNWGVGNLTVKVANFVNNKGPLENIANFLELGELLIMDKGEEYNNYARTNTKILSDATEALLGALWIDSNRDYVLLRKIVIKLWGQLELLPPLDSTSEISALIRDYELSSDECIRKVSLLMERPVSQKIIDESLIYSVGSEKIEIQKILLSKGPSKLALQNALVNAIFAGDAVLVEELLKNGADANFVYPPEKSVWNKSGYEIYDDYKDSSFSVLQIAIIEDSQPFLIIKSLLAHGADPNWNQGWSKKSTLSDMAGDILSALREEMSDIIGVSGFFGARKTHISLKAGVTSLVNQQKPIQKFQNLRTALHLLASYGANEISGMKIKVKLLIDAGADVNLRNCNGNTAYEIAQLYENNRMVEALVTYLDLDAAYANAAAPKISFF